MRKGPGACSAEACRGQQGAVAQKLDAAIWWQKRESSPIYRAAFLISGLRSGFISSLMPSLMSGAMVDAMVDWAWRRA